MATPTKRLTLWDLKKKTPGKSPKTTKRNEPSPKRPKLVDIFAENEEKAKLVNNARHLIQSVGTTVSNLGRDDILLFLVSKIGFSTTTKLINSVKHIPENFPRRDTYIQAIMGTASWDDIQLAKQCAISNSLSVTSFQITEFMDILWQRSMENMTPYMCFLSPPVGWCIHCNRKLVERSVCKVTLYTMNGPLPGLKCSLRCSSCGITYELDRFHQDSCDSQFYESRLQQDLISASGRVFFTKDVFELLCELGNHAFVSAQAFAETYNSVFHNDHPHMKKFITWQCHMGQTNTNDTAVSNRSEDMVDKTKPADDQGDCFDENKEESTPEDAMTANEMKTSGCQVMMTRKNAMNAFLNGELVSELLERKMVQTVEIGKKKSREDAMKIIDDLRRNELYPHMPEDCSSVCRERGCENLRVIDGCWKLCIPHCMMAVNVEVQGHPLLNFPNVCTAEPAPNAVFCVEHLQYLQKHNIPTEKKAFLRYIGCKENPKTSDDIRDVDEKIMNLTERMENKDPTTVVKSRSAISYQGTEKLVQNLNPDLFELQTTDKCNKDTGEKSRLRQRSRGVFVCASGGGNILCFNPLYKSESPSQVFMLTVNMIYQELKDVPLDQLNDRIESYILSYDNMCHLDMLKAAREDLPLPAPYKDMWRRIKKIIDRLHLRNHKNNACQVKYNPDSVLPEGSNTMATEQVFAWMSRYKKVVNSMTQTHHLFYIHRMCKRRNKYTGQCRRRGKEPVLPGINLCKK